MFFINGHEFNITTSQARYIALLANHFAGFAKIKIMVDDAALIPPTTAFRRSDKRSVIRQNVLTLTRYQRQNGI
jgi:hypothetical protein